MRIINLYLYRLWTFFGRLRREISRTFDGIAVFVVKPKTINKYLYLTVTRINIRYAIYIALREKNVLESSKKITIAHRTVVI